MRLQTTIIIACLGCAALAAPGAAASEAAPHWPRRVLLTNDNGIEDRAIVALARALAEVTEVTVVAATSDRSGTSNLMAATLSGRFEVERRDLGAGIRAWALAGYPADCVVFALTGPMRETPPDLVVSGINGGPNLADAWFGSGTIGAARTAAYFGVPAIAVSGVEGDDPESVRAAVEWTVRLVGSSAVRALRPPQYLTVSLPLAAPAEIRGVELSRRARGLMRVTATPDPAAEDGAELWTSELTRSGTPPPGSDAAAVAAGKIAVVAMRVDEHDPELAATLAAMPDALPAWSPRLAAAGAAGGCPSGLGLTVSTAEDDRGQELGVRIVEIAPGGRGQQIGLRPGDVLLRVDDVELVQAGPEDPHERLVRLFGSLTCGRQVLLAYERQGRRAEVTFMPAAAP